MSGNKSGADERRWQLLRCLYAGETDVLPLGAEELALIADLSVDTVHNRISNWIISGRKGVGDALASVSAMRKEASSLARETLDIITDELENLKRGREDGVSGETRLKALLSLSKTFQTLEDGINRMEKEIRNDDRYPSDVLAFRAELERHIRALEGDENP